ncbi:hypothetical protein NM22_15640 [Vibrio tubiashii]|nr:hypothetical protein NM22_15640 [Vibrio tubiashii]
MKPTINYVSAGSETKLVRLVSVMLVSFCLIIVAYYLSSYFNSEGDLVVNIHDNLDSSIAIFKVMSSMGYMFSDSRIIVPNILGGIPRSMLPSELNVVSLMYYMFEPKVAYIINETVLRIVAVFGMYLLVSRHIFKENDKDIYFQLIGLFIALAFSLLPFWSNGGLSVAGQPLLLYAYLNVRNGMFRAKELVIFSIFPFYSSLILSGMFFLFLCLIIFIYDVWEKKKVNYHLFLSILLMSILYLFAEYRLVVEFIDPSFISHRQEFSLTTLTTQQAFDRAIYLLSYGQYHAHSLHYQYITPFLIFSSLALILSNRLNRALCIFVSIYFLLSYYFRFELLHFSTNTLFTLGGIAFTAIVFIFSRKYLLTSLLLSIVGISFLSGFYNHVALELVKEKIPILAQVQFDRFYFLFPVLWFSLFSLMCKEMMHKTKWSLIPIVLVSILQVNHSFLSINGNQKSSGMDDYYSEEVFSEIKDVISKPTSSYRVMTIGFNPAIAIYNGFYTLDGYWSSYPLDHKHNFRKIIAPELEKSETWKSYFDDWGSRCRLMEANEEIELNLEQFKSMGGEFILSSKKVLINQGKGNKLLESFQGRDKTKTYYLYHVK